MAQISAQNFNRLRQRILNVVNNSDYGTNPQTNKQLEDTVKRTQLIVLQ